MSKRGKSSKDTVNRTLHRRSLSTRQVKLFKVRAKNLGLKPGYSFDKPWDLIEEIEGPDYR